MSEPIFDGGIPACPNCRHWFSLSSDMLAPNDHLWCGATYVGAIHKGYSPERRQEKITALYAKHIDACPPEGERS